MAKRKIVIIESPFRGDIAINLNYAERCMRDSLNRGESPIAIHLLYARQGILEDDFPSKRHIGTAAGDSLAQVADLTAVYTDRGVTQGMQANIDKRKTEGRKVEYRTLPNYNPSVTGS